MTYATCMSILFLSSYSHMVFSKFFFYFVLKYTLRVYDYFGISFGFSRFVHLYIVRMRGEGEDASEGEGK